MRQGEHIWYRKADGNWRNTIVALFPQRARQDGYSDGAEIAVYRKPTQAHPSWRGRVEDVFCAMCN